MYRRTALSIATLAILSLPVAAADLAPPSSEAILTVTGAVGTTNLGDAAVFDREMLADLGVITFTTTTIWTEGEQSFTGVPLAAILAEVAPDATAIRLTAINDYSVDLPVSELSGDFPVVAFLQNGAPMTVRERGPLWVVYPYDLAAEFRSEVIYSRSVWQLDRIEIIE